MKQAPGQNQNRIEQYTSKSSSQLTMVPCGVWAITSGIPWEPARSGVSGDRGTEKLDAVDAKDDDFLTYGRK